MDENDLKMQLLNAGISEEQYKEIKEKMGEHFFRLSNMFYELIEAFKQMRDVIFTVLDDFDFLDYFERDPIEKTPYLFKSKTRIYDKRPHKQHHVRNNCRKEWKKGGVLYV